MSVFSKGSSSCNRMQFLEYLISEPATTGSKPSSRLGEKDMKASLGEKDMKASPWEGDGFHLSGVYQSALLPKEEQGGMRLPPVKCLRAGHLVCAPLLSNFR